MTADAPTREQAIADAAQCLADHFGDAWERIREGFGAAQPAA